MPVPIADAQGVDDVRLHIQQHTQPPYQKYEDPSVVEFCNTVKYKYQKQLLNFALEPDMPHTSTWFIVRIESGATIAVAIVQESCDATLVCHVAVLGAYRRRGVGTKLMKHVFSNARRQSMILTTHRADGGIKFFTSLGFEQGVTAEQFVDALLCKHPVIALLFNDREEAIRDFKKKCSSHDDPGAFMKRGAISPARLLQLADEYSL